MSPWLMAHPFKRSKMPLWPTLRRFKGWKDNLIIWLAVELNRMEEEEFQSQLMAIGPYMIDEDDSSNLHHEYVQATATLGSEVVFEKIVSEPCLKGPFGKSCDQFEFDLDWVPEQDEAL
jgi:hypothetical protein